MTTPKKSDRDEALAMSEEDVRAVFPRLRASHSRITLQPEYGRFVTAFCGTFCPGVADQGLTQGAAPRSSSARIRADTSA
jgi:hypothetical protein